MAVGSGAITSFDSYLAVGKETTYGTAVTTTAGIPFISSSLKTLQEGKILEQIETSRVYSQQIRMGKVIEGEVEGYFYPALTGCAYLLQSGFGMPVVTSATATGETTGGGGFTHTFLLGQYVGTYSSLSLNNRKGDSASAKVFKYTGMKVNELTFSAELDEALKYTVSLVGKDSTSGATDISSAITLSAMSPLSFVNGRISVEGSVGSLTSASYWHVQSVSFGVNNNLKSDAESRRIGSDTLDVLPVGIANLPLTLTMRYDTTTAYDAMLANSTFSVELEFLGPTITGSVARQGIKFIYPVVKINDAGDPEIGGPDEILSSEVVCNVLRDASSAGGYAIRAELTNAIATI